MLPNAGLTAYTMKAKKQVLMKMKKIYSGASDMRRCWTPVLNIFLTSLVNLMAFVRKGKESIDLQTAFLLVLTEILVLAY